MFITIIITIQNHITLVTNINNVFVLKQQHNRISYLLGDKNRTVM